VPEAPVVAAAGVTTGESLAHAVAAITATNRTLLPHVIDRRRRSESITDPVVLDVVRSTLGASLGNRAADDRLAATNRINSSRHASEHPNAVTELRHVRDDADAWDHPFKVAPLGRDVRDLTGAPSSAIGASPVAAVECTAPERQHRMTAHLDNRTRPIGMVGRS
jgi:hypothetical protein